MKKHMNAKRLIGILLLSALLLSLSAPALAAEPEARRENSVDFHPVSGEAVSASALETLNPGALVSEELGQSPVSLAETVRVSIVLEEEPTLAAGYSAAQAAEDPAALSYREGLLARQNDLTAAIEKRLGGKLDVQWNLTLAANLISANVRYGQIAAIEAVPGVKEVVPEAQYYPAVEPWSGEETLDPQMSLSVGMTGVNQLFTAGYTGAGSRVAIVDTGIDTDHQSFSAEAFRYAIGRGAAAAGMSYEDYAASLNWLDAGWLQEHLYQLNAKKILSAVTAEELYYSEKLPFAFNYVDKSTDVTHDNDAKGDHGSHVAGIAAANRYVKTAEGAMADAAQTVAVVGNAPDAQLLVMKVFGTLGGAFDSDIVAAIEDAIILGADSVNLSLGSNMNGFSTSSVYARVMELVRASDIIMCVAAGNDGAWADYSNTNGFLPAGYLYADDVNYDRVSNPASLADSLTVASVDNSGTISDATITAIGENGESFTATYSESLYNNMKSLTTLDTSDDKTGTEYEFVFTDGYGEAGDFDFIDLEGKIAIISRGQEIPFYEKASYAVDCGAVATIIYNNESGTIGMDMSSYTYEQPCVSITKEEGAAIKALAARQLDDDNNVYYTGRLLVKNGLTVVPAQDKSYNMSYFSSWGTLGDLTLKPEITAPGGNIFSVRGDTADTDKYKSMSGTSMATPQVAGIVGIFREYLRKSGLEEKTGLSARQLTQSLLMSTAVPMKDSAGRYFPLLRQGAGLAYATGMVGANSVILMDRDATASWEDGKVKAELGDDPERTGVYSFSFTIYNTTGEDETFDLTADTFTQDYVRKASNLHSPYLTKYALPTTHTLKSSLTVTAPTQSGNSVTVPAGGTAKVSVTLTLAESAKSWLNAGFPKGNYVQAFLYVTPRTSGDGAVSAVHSIPVLAFYGNWTDPSMYNGPSFCQGEILTTYSTPSTTDKSRATYPEDYENIHLGNRFVSSSYGKNHANITTSYSGGSYAYGGNPLVPDAVYMPERDALSNGAVLDSWSYSLMRDRSSYTYQVKDLTDGTVYLENRDEGDYQGAYYSKSARVWQCYSPITVRVNYKLPELPEDHILQLSFAALPEYYDAGKLGEHSQPGSGAVLSIKAAVDGVAPSVRDIVYENGRLDVTACDSNYIAAVILYDGEGKEVLSYTGAKQEIARGEEATYSVKAAMGGRYMLQVFDYAMNAATYTLTVKEDGILYSGNKIAFDLAEQSWVRLDKRSAELPAVTDSGRVYTAAAADGDSIYAVAYGTELYRLSVSDPSEPSYIGDVGLNPVDLAWSPAEGRLYGVTEDSKLITIDVATGSGQVLGSTPIKTNTLAIDAEGRFYSNQYASGRIWSYTLDSVKKGNTAFDFSGDGVVNEADAQALLDYVNGARGSIQKQNNADVDGDGDVDTYDARLLLERLPARARLLTTMAISSKYMQSMTIDPNDGTLYWASYSADHFGDTEITFSVLYEIDTETGAFKRYFDVGHQLSCLLALDKEAGRVYEPVAPLPGIDTAPEGLYQPGSESGAIDEPGYTPEEKAAFLAWSESGAGSVTLELSSGQACANGLYRVEYDPAVLTLREIESEAGLTSRVEGEGSLTLAFAGSVILQPGRPVAVLRFSSADCGAECLVTCEQLENERPGTALRLDAGAHEWGDWSVTAAATCVAAGERSRSCAKCGKRETEALAVDENAHNWGEWVTTKEATASEPGERRRLCADCGAAAYDWLLHENMSTTEQEEVNFGLVNVNEFFITAAQVFQTGVSRVWRLSTEDGSIRYLAELSSSTPRNGAINVHMINWLGSASGIGYAIKRTWVESVGARNGGSDLDYTVQLTNGMGSMRCWSYEHSDYREFDLYFYVGDTDSGSGVVKYFSAPTTDKKLGDQYLTRVGIWNMDVVKAIWDEPVIESKTVERFALNIWIDPEAALTTDYVALEFKTNAGAVYEVGQSANLVGRTVVVPLVNGRASIEVRTPPRVSIVHPTRYYTINVNTRTNVAPELAVPATEASAAIDLGETYSLDLSKVFRDADEDALSYSVSVNGAAETPADAAYSLRPDSAGVRVLRFRAEDGEFSSPVYTVVLTVRRAGVLAGDVNGDGEINAKDVTVLKRYLARWIGVTIDEAAADVNNDGSVDAKDVTILKRYLAGWVGVSLG